ncbi:MAG: transcriptional regulator, partial [Raoultibacter sp.]
ETDKTYPDVENLLLLSVLFDVTIDELIKGDVEAMKDVISNDYKTMNALSIGGVIIAIMGVVLFFGGVAYWNWSLAPSIIVGVLVYGIGVGMLVKVERLKKQHDLVTYRELVAFAKGQPIDRDNSHSQRARQHRLLKGVIVTLIAAVLGGILGYCSYAFGLIG